MQIRPEPDLARFRNSNPAGGRSRIRIWGELVSESGNSMPDETSDVSSAVSCYKEAVQFSDFFVMPVFATF